MTINEYQGQIAQNINRELTVPELTNAALYGLCSGVGDLQKLYQGRFYGKDCFPKAIKNRIAYIGYELANLCAVNDWDLEDVLKLNLRK